MKIDHYRRLLDRNKDDEVRVFGRRLLRKAGGRALVAALPSKQKIRAVARRHVDVTLGLADLRLRLGPLRLSGNVFRSLNEHLETASWDKEDDERYRFYSQRADRDDEAAAVDQGEAQHHQAAKARPPMTEPVRILFLDVDGVLNRTGFLPSDPRTSPRHASRARMRMSVATSHSSRTMHEKRAWS